MQAELREESATQKSSKIVMDELIKQVLKGWGEWAVRFDGKPAAGPAPLELERSVVVSGGMQGVLVLRCPSGFGRALAASRNSDATGEPESAFRDFSQQVAHRLLETLAQQCPHPMVLTAPINSTHRQWPAGRPRLSLAVLVDGLPLEVRLWLKGGMESRDDLHLDSSSRRAAQRVRARNMAAAAVMHA
jgi:hypothetical protein